MVRCIFPWFVSKVLMNEEDSEDEFSGGDSTPASGPSVVTFQDPAKKSEVTASDKVLKKAFMVCNFLRGHTYLTQLSRPSVVENF